MDLIDELLDLRRRGEHDRRDQCDKSLDICGKIWVDRPIDGLSRSLADHTQELVFPGDADEREATCRTLNGSGFSNLLRWLKMTLWTRFYGGFRRRAWLGVRHLIWLFVLCFLSRWSERSSLVGGGQERVGRVERGVIGRWRVRIRAHARRMIRGGVRGRDGVACAALWLRFGGSVRG